MDVNEAVGWLQWNGLFIGEDSSVDTNIKCLQIVYENCVEDIVKVINLFLESNSKCMVLETKFGPVHLTLRDPTLFSINLCYGIPFLCLKKIDSKELIHKLFGNVLNYIDPYEVLSWNLFKVVNFLLTVADNIPTKFLLQNILIAEYMLKIATNRYHKYIEATIKASIKLLPHQLLSQLFDIYCSKVRTNENLCCYTLAELISQIDTTLIDDDTVELIFKFIKTGLYSNIESFQVALLYQSLIHKMEFSEWEVMAKKYLKGRNSSFKRFVLQFYLIFSNLIFYCSDTYGQSFCNHIIPITLKRFPSSYDVLSEVEPRFAAYSILTMHRKNILNLEEFFPKILQFIRHFDDYISLIGLEIFLTFKSKNIQLTPIYYNQVMCFLIQRVITLDDIKQICKLLNIFHSHIIVATNAKMKQNEGIDITEVKQYFEFLCKFCLMYCKELNAMKNELGYKILYQLCELLLDDSSKLKVQYNLAGTDHYEKRQNPLLLRIMSEGNWNLTSKTTLKELLQSYCNNGYTGNVFENLLNDFYDLDDETIISSLHSKCLEYFETSNMLFTSKAASLHAIRLKHNIAVGKSVKTDADFITATFRERVATIRKNEATIENFLNCPVLAVVRTMDKILNEEHLSEFIDFGELFDLFYELFDYYLEKDGEIALFKGTTAGKAVEATLIVSIIK